jgi:two-component sensor histidine kinase
MHRLASFDVTSKCRTKRSRIVAQIGFGVICALVMIALRSVFDVWAPTSGPFALVYPTILIATLYGHWQAGAVAYLISFFWAWWFILPTVNSFSFEVPTDPSRVVINVVSVLVVLLLAEVFRRAVRLVTQARDAQIERGRLLMKELEHRTKNNFALVASLLSLQRRRHDEPEILDALDQAIGRVDTFARAYENLKIADVEGTFVSMRLYVHDVVTRVSAGAFPDEVTIEVQASDCELPQQTAVAIGLFINEALTNCAKYAFPDGAAGKVRVSFSGDADNWELQVSDNGVGDNGVSDNGTRFVSANGDGRKNGMGHGLMDAFARQAEAEYFIGEAQRGRIVHLRRGAE